MRSEAVSDLDLLAACPPDVRAKIEDAGATRALADVIAAGMSAWPAVRVDARVLTAAVARSLEGQDVNDELARLRVEELALTTAAAAGDPHALAALEASYISLVPAALARLRLSSDELTEALQLLRVRLLVPSGDTPARIGEFRGRGALASWLGVCALRIALRMRASARPSDDLDQHDLDQDHGGVTGALAPHVQRQAHALFATAFKQALGELDGRNRLLLAEHYLDRLSLETMAELHQVHRATVARQLARARDQVLVRTREILRASGQLSDTECESIVTHQRHRGDSGAGGREARRFRGGTDEQATESQRCA